MIDFVSRSDAQDAVRRWHSHHEPHIGERFALGWRDDNGGGLRAVIVVGRPVSQVLQAQGAWEVTRLAVGPDAPDCCASRLLGAGWGVMRSVGVRRAISYTRIDEAGTCYRAAGWVAVALVVPEDWERRRLRAAARRCGDAGRGTRHHDCARLGR